MRDNKKAKYMQGRRGLKRTVIENASANLVRLGASGTVALLLPSFLVRKLPIDTYSTWALLLQLTAYVAFLDFGIQTSVARFVAHADELGDPQQRDGIVSTAFLFLVLAAALGLSAVGVLAWQLPHVFTAMPTSLRGDARIALLLMGGSFALGLPVSVIHAVFIGQQRNKIPVSILIVNRLTMAVLIVFAVQRHKGLAAMGEAVAIAQILSCGLSCIALSVWAPQTRIRIALASNFYAKKISSYMAALGVWQFGMLLISGLDLSIVGIFDYSEVAYYAIAVTLTNFVVQTQNAIFSALLPTSAVLNARGDSRKLGALLVFSTRYGMLILLAAALPLVLAGKLLLTIWVGKSYALHGTLIMQILVVANVVRLSFLPYATLLLGTGQQGKVVMSPLAEGSANLLTSVVGAHFWGAIGVAIGTLVGSFVSVGTHLWYNVPRISAIGIDRPLLIKEGLFRPLLCAVPLSLLAILNSARPQMQATLVLFLWGVAIIGTGYLFWNFGLIGSERQQLGNAFRA